MRLTEVTRPVLQRYQRHLYHAQSRGGKPMSAGAQFNRLMAIKVFFRFLTRENVLLYNPASELELPKLEKRLPKDILTAEETERVLSQPDVETPLGIRDRAILEVFYSTGIRRTELIDLERNCLTSRAASSPCARARAKKTASFPSASAPFCGWKNTSPTCAPSMRRTTSTRCSWTRPARKWTATSSAARCASISRRAGVNKQGRCHLFRHTMATLMLENGADIRYIQQMLGHAKLSTTEIYTHVSILKLKQVHALTHPARLPPDVPGGKAEALHEIVRARQTGDESGAESPPKPTRRQPPTCWPRSMKKRPRKTNPATSRASKAASSRPPACSLAALLAANPRSQRGADGTETATFQPPPAFRNPSLAGRVRAAQNALLGIFWGWRGSSTARNPQPIGTPGDCALRLRWASASPEDPNKAAGQCIKPTDGPVYFSGGGYDQVIGLGVGIQHSKFFDSLDWYPGHGNDRRRLLRYWGLFRWRWRKSE